MASKQESKKLLAEQASQSGEEFIQLYYDTFDKRRHVVSKLYSDASSLVWNGHLIKGSDKLNEFFVSLPTTIHNIHSMDCQPVSERAVPGSTTIAVFVGGTVEYEDTKPKIFSQNFVLTAEGKVWKVVLFEAALATVAWYGVEPSKVRVLLKQYLLFLNTMLFMVLLLQTQMKRPS